MASIREKKKDGKIISYRFTACLERDSRGKQVRRYCTWIPPEGLTPAKIRKAAQRAADDWEEEIRAEYNGCKEAAQKVLSCTLPRERRQDDFVSFVNDIWFSLYICNGDRKGTTVAFYEDIAKYLTAYFEGAILQEITPIQIQLYLRHFRTEHEKRTGKPLTARALRHHYGVLRNIFGYAEKNDMLEKNPMKRVDAPVIPKKPVDALSPEQAKIFFEKLSECPLDFQTLLQLFITTGLRRGEAVGIKWKDIDEKKGLLHVERAVAHTTQTGTVISTPKTASSIRTVPLIPSTLRLLMQLNKTSLSNGEKQIFIMALYHSLVQLCNHEIPFIIDTPFARIDTEHRRNISTHFFCKLNGQVFILSTNEEINSAHVQIMGDKIAATYMLENTDNKRTTVVSNRYF